MLSTDGGRSEVEGVLAAAKESVAHMLEEHRNVVEALRDALLDREELIGDDIPVVAGLDFGHTDPMFTIPLGARCELSTDRKRITFVETAVE